MDELNSKVAPLEGFRVRGIPIQDFYVTNLERQLLRRAAMEKTHTCCLAETQPPTAHAGGERLLVRSVLRDSVYVFLSLIMFLCLVTHMLD
ncbi:hypothetical protein JKF63_07456 [Porcisia hertigi]|uniref:Uncharacterized protein n=1 Tax=Porcisia hertigi TaxID=2761500 RepID=A0A836LGE2_9TRYP|nr:hypothetical protein JKF63_07456 [Porcisia hertigi]